MSEPPIERDYKPPFAVFTIPLHYLALGRPCDVAGKEFVVEAVLDATVKCPLLYCKQEFVVVGMKLIRPKITKIFESYTKMGVFQETIEVETNYRAEVRSVSQPLLPE